MPGNTARSTRLCVLLACRGRSPERGPASVLCVVEVTKSQCSTGFGCRPAATRPAKCAMSQSSSAPTSSAISRNLSVSTVRGYAEPPQTISFGRASLRLREHLVVVDEHRLARHAVVGDRVEPPGEVDLEPVREVAAVRELEREDRVARLQHRHVDGHVRLSAGVRLDVRVLGAEELLRAVDRELLDLVDDLAAAVVPLAGIALRVLVRRRRADRLEDRRPGEVLRGDQLDLVALPLELAAEQRRRSPGRSRRAPRSSAARRSAARRPCAAPSRGPA